MNRTAPLLATIGVCLASCGGDDATTLSGTFTLSDTEGFTGDWDNCQGSGGYSDFGPGMNVTVRDGSGDIVGSGSTRSLNATDLPDGYDPDDDLDLDRIDTLDPIEQTAAVAEEFGTLFGCVVVIDDVEISDADFYTVTVGRRGELSYTANELEAAGFLVELSLGG